MNVDVSILTGFLAGLASFITPCVLPMVPVYLMYLTGYTSVDDLSKDRLKTFFRSLFFVLGFTIVFVLLGMSATAFGRFLIKNKALFRKICSVIILVFALSMMGVIKIKGLNRFKLKKSNGLVGALLMGMAFSIGWSPCFGPVLGTILTLAAQKDTILKGATLLFSYSLGLGIPFIISGFFAGEIRKFFNKKPGMLKKVNFVAGIIMAIFAVLLYFDIFRFLS